MASVVSIALPVFAVIVLGFLAGRMSLMSPGDSAVLNRFVFRFAMPAALFGLTAGTPPPGGDEAAIAIAYAIASFSALFGAYALARIVFRLKEQDAGAHAFASTLGNAVFLGLPIALSVEGWARPFITLMLIEGTLMIAVATAMIAPRRTEGSVMSRAFNYFIGPARNPLVIGMALGFVYSASGLSFSGPVETFFSLIGRAAGPAALFSMGLFLASQKLDAFRPVAGRVSAIALVKLAALPAIALGIARFQGVEAPYLGALALFVLVPTGVGAFVMASQYGVYTRQTAAAVSFTTLISVLTISAVLAIFA